MSPKAKSKGNESIEELICDYQGSKYEVTMLAMKWARHIKKLEDYREQPMADIIEVAIRDVLSGKVSPEEVKKAVIKDAEIEEALLNKREDGKGREKREESKTADKKEKEEKQ
ncbi:MAG: hypothetical protein KAI33_04700 [Elusimicrobiales bacterium]|nr:hypothetical protein [Elusimicrobiales bacterium]MCK5583063.1 hypothetical protein [Elusimicrobiales bacterium]